MKSYTCRRVKPYTCVKLGVTIAIGLTVGLLAVGLAVGTENLIIFKNDVARQIIHDGRPLGVLRAALFHIAFSVVLVLIGSSMVCILGTPFNRARRGWEDHVAAWEGYMVNILGTPFNRARCGWEDLVAAWEGHIGRLEARRGGGGGDSGVEMCRVWWSSRWGEVLDLQGLNCGTMP